ncbi:fimbrillin family protein [Bacteroides sp.]
MNNTFKTAAGHSLTAVIFSLFFSCTNSIQSVEEPSLPPASGNIPIAISAQILQVQVKTRTVNNDFEENDAIGLYVLAQPGALSGARHIENVRFVYSSAGFTSDEEIYYPKGDGKCDFISYYPYQEEGVIQNSNSMQISVNSDQSSTVDYTNSDFMVAKTEGITPSMKAVNLKHNHKLCQLNIILQLYKEEDIIELQKDASISISNLNTKATYNMDTELFSSFSGPLNITPNGEWQIDEENHQLTGKKAILIPQPTTDCELILRTNNKTYSAPLPTDLELESGTSCELLLRYDSRVGIGNISSSIGEWQQGSSSEADLKEEENNNSIDIINLNFEKTGVYNLVTSTDVIIGEICKEYLLSDNIDAQAIVLYPVGNREEGTVLQILGENNNLHGGSARWDIANNSLTYTAGNKAPIEQVYADKDGNIIFEKNDDIQQIEAEANVLTDTRGAETLTYPIVKIGTQYWMRENLNTTKYKDATNIANNTGNVTKTTAGYYLQNANRFYNKAVIVKGNIAPQGWKIPDVTEWEKLKTYIKDDAATLKTGIWNSVAEIPKANNKTGFNGKAVGIYSKNTGKDESSYGFSQQYAGYWTVNGNQTTPDEKSTALNYKLKEIGKVFNTDYCAYSIRCIKE